MRGHRFFLAVLLSFLLATVSSADSGKNEKATQSRTTHVLQSSVFGSAGAPGTSTQYESNGTLGQPTPIGVGSSDNHILYAGFWKSVVTATGILEGIIPDLFKNALFPNAPNPFNPVTTIRYEVGQNAPVDITIYNIQGRVVRNLVQETKAPGRYEIVWDGHDDLGSSVGSGVYLCRLQIGKYGSVRKMVLVK